MLLPDHIVIEHPEKYALLIRITPDVFTVCIHELASKKNCYYRELPFVPEDGVVNDIEQIIFDSEFLILPFGRVGVIFVSNDYDLVPSYIIKKDKKKILYNFTHQTPASEILYCEDMVQQIVTVFNVEEKMHQFLSRNLSNPIFYHHSNLVMQYLDQRNKEENAVARMYLNLHDEFVDIFSYDPNSQFLHAVTYRNENERNLIYHVLNFWDKCGFNQKEDILYIVGDSVRVSFHVSSTLGEYIKKVKHMRISDEIKQFENNVMGKEFPLDQLILTAK